MYNRMYKEQNAYWQILLGYVQNGVLLGCTSSYVLSFGSLVFLTERVYRKILADLFAGSYHILLL